MNDQVHPPVKPINPYVLLFVGIAMCSVPLLLMFFSKFSENYAQAQLPLSLFMALGAGLVGAAFPGAIQLNLPGVKAAGAAAMFALVLYLGNPNAEQRLVEEQVADNTAVLNQPSARSDTPENPQDDSEIASELPANPIDFPRLAQRNATADIGEETKAFEPAAETAELPSGWIYLGHKTVLGNWGTRHFNGNELPQQGDVITVMSENPRPLMDQSPKLKGLKYDFGNKVAEAHPNTRLKVEQVKVVGLGKVWAQVHQHSEERG